MPCSHLFHSFFPQKYLFPTNSSAPPPPLRILIVAPLYLTGPWGSLIKGSSSMRRRVGLLFFNFGRTLRNHQAPWWRWGTGWFSRRAGQVGWCIQWHGAHTGRTWLRLRRAWGWARGAAGVLKHEDGKLWLPPDPWPCPLSSHTLQVMIHPPVMSPDEAAQISLMKTPSLKTYTPNWFPTRSESPEARKQLFKTHRVNPWRK